MRKILLIGEPLIRLTPSYYQTLNNHVDSTIFYGGSEINIARNLQGFGFDTKVLTGLPDNPVGNSFETFMQSYGIDTSSIIKIGDRIGLYYHEEGIGIRNAQVYYDRSHTSIMSIKPEHIDMDAVLSDVALIHFSGITIAIDDNIEKWLIIILEEAKKRGIPISMDLNWRSKLISMTDAKVLFSRFMQYADYGFGIEPLKVSEEDIAVFDRENASLDILKKRMEEVKKTFGLKYVFHTQRSQDDNGNNVYNAYALGTDLVTSKRIKTRVLQRIGSGDAFVSGALAKIVQQKSLQEIVDFAVASASYKCTVLEDSMYVSMQQVENVLKQGGDVVR